MIRIKNMRFEIGMAVTVEIAVNWDVMVMDCSLVERYYYLGECAASIFRMKTEAAHSSEILVPNITDHKASQLRRLQSSHCS
jgi:hypothetical protein